MQRKKFVFSLLLNLTITIGITACGGSGDKENPGGENTGTGSIDVRDYAFPPSNATRHFDQYYYDGGVQEGMELSAVTSVTSINGNIITTTETEDGESETTVYTVSGTTISSDDGIIYNRFVDVGDTVYTFSFTYDFGMDTPTGFQNVYVEETVQCDLEEQLDSFSMMSDRSITSYATHNDVLTLHCLTTINAYEDNSKNNLHFTGTDLSYSYAARGFGIIGDYDLECNSYNEALDIAYPDDLNPAACEDHPEEYYEAAVEPSV